MYEPFFGLNDKPFSLLPDPDYLYMSSKHALALSILEYSLAGQAGFCAITGEIGSGKTTLIRAMLRRIGRDMTVGLISNTHSGLNDITGWALAAFGREPTAQTNSNIYQTLMHFLIDEYGAGRRCVLIVDEAQNLTIEALEELRLLSNINSDKDLLLQIILVGQPELLAKLKQPELRQFAQRVNISYHLTPLTYLETRRYIRHRLEIAGSGRPIFSDTAIGAVQFYSGGVPRIINSICDMAMVYGLGEDRPDIEIDLVLRVIGDRQTSGVAPFARNESPDDPAVAAEITSMVREALDLRAVPVEDEIAAAHAMAPGPLLSESDEIEPDLLLDDELARNNGRSNGRAAADNYPWLEVPRTDRKPYGDLRVDEVSREEHRVEANVEAKSNVRRPSWFTRFKRTS
jgi:type II secretory pathway predicted ATPase ExeA